MTEEEAKDLYKDYVKDATPEGVLQSEEETKKRAKESSALSALIDMIDLAYNYVRDCVRGDYKNFSGPKLSLLIGGLAYLALPVDICPDVIPFFGFLDDAAVLGGIFKIMSDELTEYKNWKGR